MNDLHDHVGLVLAGGGAKGAYQVGALKYLAEIGVNPKIIAGTSIGALNGAVLASYHPFSAAVVQLDRLWEELGQVGVLRPNASAAVHLAGYAAQAFTPHFKKWMLDFLVEQGLLRDPTALFDPEPIEQFLQSAIQAEALRQGTELWVTVFPSLEIPGLDYDYLLDLIQSILGTKAEWLRIQDCQDDETLYNLLLASAAIPLAFPSREVNRQRYVDGGLADNIPLGALAARGCTQAIVIHLDNGEPWSRHSFPEQTVIEIRPELPINQFDFPIIGKISSLLDFNPYRIAELKQRGYEDAKRCMEPILATFSVVNQERIACANLLASTQQLLQDEKLPL